MLREAFSAFGEVTDVFLPMERGTNRPRGFGFVTFADRNSMDQNALEKSRVIPPRAIIPLKIQEDALISEVDGKNGASGKAAIC